MTRRLQAATEEALLTGGRAGRRAIEDAGFDSELKEKLLDKIADAKFRKQYSGAIAAADLSIPASAGQGTIVNATGQPWTGDEQTSDAVLRMLDDARKPLRPELRGKFSAPKLSKIMDTRIGKTADRRSPGQRVAAAKEKAAVYNDMGMKNVPKQGLSEKEKEEMRQEFRDRFQPGARALPNTISGLTALANERIEDAIARGQFKDIPRGMKDNPDPRANSPFIDTTEYLMNRIIQRQDIVPPWIEKQQEVAKMANSFRQRLRNDWRRHAARMIASEGGSLFDQMKKAEAFARAEEKVNPRRRQSDGVVPATATDDVVMAKMREQAKEVDGIAAALKDMKAELESAAAAAAGGEEKSSERGTGEAENTGAEHEQQQNLHDLPMVPYRDPVWEKAEKSYLELSIKQLNDTTRSYNLMAPNLAKKPYYSLQRELLACYADIAPQLANEIKQRATRPRGSGLKVNVGVYEKKGDGLMGHFGKDDVKIHLERNEKAYGLKEWWSDVWKKV